MIKTSKPSSFSIDCHDVCSAVEFSPFEWSSSLLAFGTSSIVSVGVCKFQQEDENIDGMSYEKLLDFNQGSVVTNIAWSPEASLDLVPKVIRFCTSDPTGKIRFYSSDGRDNDSVMVLEGHTGYVNSVVFSPDSGEHIASAGDDHTCCIWGLDGSKKACLPLCSPGMSVLWHPDEPMKILVAEKNGILRFYNLHTQEPIMSLDCGRQPLMSADWCLTNPLAVGCIANNDWFLFDTSNSSCPIERQKTHIDTTRNFRWCRSHEQLLAVGGRTGSDVKIFNIKSKQSVLSSTLKVCNGLTWHLRLPAFAVGSHRSIHLWLIEVT